MMRYNIPVTAGTMHAHLLKRYPVSTNCHDCTMNYANVIRSNASKIVELYQRINDTLPYRDKSEEYRRQWSDACSEFHKEYNELAFLGGVDTARDRLRSGDVAAIEYTLDFLQIRPYFFRSGYMYNDFMRVLRNCPLSESQSRRYDDIRERYLEYRAKRKQNAR